MTPKTIVALDANCDQGKALHYVLDLLLAMDLDGSLLEETDEEYRQKCQAEAALVGITWAWRQRKK
jgi:hypothetical protein